MKLIIINGPNLNLIGIREKKIYGDISFETYYENLLKMFEKGKKDNIETRGISDHGFISSIYFRDPNGYVVELTAKNASYNPGVSFGSKKVILPPSNNLSYMSLLN